MSKPYVLPRKSSTTQIPYVFMSLMICLHNDSCFILLLGIITNLPKLFDERQIKKCLSEWQFTNLGVKLLIIFEICTECSFIRLYSSYLDWLDWFIVEVIILLSLLFTSIACWLDCGTVTGTGLDRCCVSESSWYDNDGDGGWLMSGEPAGICGELIDGLCDGGE